MSQLFFHIIFITSFIAIFVIRAYYYSQVRESVNEVEYDKSDWQPRVRRYLGRPYGLLFFLYLIWPRLLSFAQVELPVWAQWLGVLLSLISITLLFWVHKTLGTNFDVKLHVREGHTLVTGGPYHWVRHPMYTTFFIWGTAILLLTGNLLIAGPFLISMLLIVATRVAKEETKMIETFGQAYVSYMKSSGRFLPKLNRG